MPFAACPFGTAHFSPETREGLRFFHPDDVTFQGFRLTHQFSPWLKDYNTFTLSACIRESEEIYQKPKRTTYRRRSTSFTPAALSVHLNLYDIDLSLFPTAHGGIFTAAFGSSSFLSGERVLSLSVPSGSIELRLSPDKKRLYLKLRNGTSRLSDKFFMYCVLDFDTSCVSMSKESLSASVFFGGDTRIVTVRFATSMISFEQAEYLLDIEVSGRSADTIRAECENAWEKALSRIEIDVDDELKRTFYSCMYHCFLFPIPLHELCPDGKTRYRYPENGEVYEGVLYTDMALWDSYRTLFPLLSILYPERYAEICDGLMSYYRHSGWLPRSMGGVAINCMPGTVVDNIFADGAVKEIITDRKKLSEMLKALCKHANEPSPVSAYGRDGIEEFNSLGYVSTDHNESVNKTIDYSYGNFCISKIAEILGNTKLAERMRESSKNYRRLFDPETGYLRGRDSKGNMRGDFTKYDWGGEYTEAGPMQTSLAACHDIMGYAELLGGVDILRERLEALFLEPPLYRLCGYSEEIHEMTEMAEFPDFGQCALSNQPSFHIPYLFSCIGDRDSTCYWVRRAVNELFSSADGFPGDEDTGSMSAWYIFSVLGFYPVCQGTGEYMLASPSVKKAKIHLPDGNVLNVNCNNFSASRIYSRKIVYNGKRLDGSAVTHRQIMCGGELSFELSEN